MSSFKVKLFTAVLILLLSIPFYWHSEKVGYAKGQSGKLTTEEQCAEATNANFIDWFACLTVHGVSDCVMTYKTDDYFEDKGCLRYLNENKAMDLESNNKTSSAICSEDEC